MNTNQTAQNAKQRSLTGNVPPRGNILSIFGDAQCASTLESALTAKGFTVVRARHAMHGVWLAITGCPDAIITDQVRPCDESSYLLDCLKRNPNTAIIPVISMVDSLQQIEPSVSRLSEVAACYLKSSPTSELIDELDRQVAEKVSSDAVPPTRGDISRFDAFFEELGHTAPKAPWVIDGFFRNDVLEPEATLFPSGYTIDAAHGKPAPRLGKTALPQQKSRWSTRK